MLRGVIFDLGHTLIMHAHGEDWARIRPRMIADLSGYLQSQAGLQIDPAAFAQTFARQLAAFDEQRRSHFVEYTARQILLATLEQLGLPCPPPEALKEALRSFFAYSETLWRPMPEVYSVLEELRGRGLKLALISNAMDADNVQRLIDNHGLRGYFDPIVVSAAAGIRKPNPAIFAPVLQRWQLQAHEVAMVGDTLGADVLGAMNAGLHSVWLRIHADRPDNVAHGQHLRPAASVDALAEVPSALSRLDGLHA